MQTNSGELNRIKSQEEYDAILKAQKEALLAKVLPEKIIVPDDVEEQVINMTRRERRAWARAEAKRLARR